jgi:hypothetical protein
MKNFLLPFLLSLIFCTHMSSQMASGTTAPGFNLVDLDGNLHDLYADYLDQDIDVIIDFSATWCGPCWSYHNGGTLKNFYNAHGPNGSGDAMVFFIEPDQSTNEACLYGPSGCVGGTQGNWVNGTPYPIINTTSTNGPGTGGQWQVSFFPTVYFISSANKKVYYPNTPQPSAGVINNWFFGSFQMAADASITDAVCGGDGEISLTVTAGYGNKTYAWNNGATSKDLVNLSPGGYVCTITDANGYQIVTDPFIVGGTYVPVSAFNGPSVQPSCYNGTNGSVTVLATAGNGGYSYLWDDGQTTPSKLNIGAGEHYVTVTDVMGCTFETLAILGQPTQVTASVQAPPIPCGQNNGTATIAANGGTGPYIYSLGSGTQSTGVFSNLAPATYNYSVADNQGCDVTGEFTITAVAGPTAVSAAAGGLTCVVTQTQVSGTGSATGANISYAWTTQNGTIVSGADQLVATVSAGGTYTLQVTDATNGCTSTSSAVVVADTALPVLSVTNGELTCVINSVQLCATADPGLTVTWNVNGQNSQGSCVTVNAAGSYPASVTAANGCTSSVNAVVTASGDLPQISIAVPSNLTCIQPEVTLQGSVVGDVSEFTILWTTTNGNIVSGANTLTPVVDAGGSYNKQVTRNSNGCVSNSVAMVEEVINTANGAYQYTLNAGTFNGQAVASGATTTYAWDFGNGMTSTEANPSVSFAPGTYNVCLTVTTECGSNTVCQSVTYSTILTGTTSAQNVVCFGENNGQASATVTGGVEPFNYLWTGPNGYTSSQSSITGLAPGVYTVVITDATNATFSQTVTITEPNNIKASSVSIINDSNNQGLGAITIAAEGGTGNLSYLWSNGATTPNISNLSAGTYSCIITDGNGCSKTFGPFTVEDVSSTNETKFIHNFSVYPNPATNMINLEVNFVKSTNVEMTLTNSIGNKVITKQYSGNINDGIDVSALTSGLYFVMITGENFNVSRRVVVLK